jgi:tRNA threonylcarbamoyl adenosine modification protein (Sua5/YciO/YrdC/YwlC family)
LRQSKVGRWKWEEDPEDLRRTVDRGGVLVVPTESSYALAADPCNHEAVRTVFRIKRRAADMPLPVIVGSIAMISHLGLEMPARGLSGLEQAWPGAPSILLRCTKDIPAAAGTGHLAVRIPGHDRLVNLLSQLGRALTATSANRSGRRPLLEAEEAFELVQGEDAMIVDDGRLVGGAPSTLVSLGPKTGPAKLTILRQGRVGRERLEELAPQWFSAAPVEIPVEESR